MKSSFQVNTEVQGDGEKGNVMCDKQVGGMDELQMNVDRLTFLCFLNTPGISSFASSSVINLKQIIQQLQILVMVSYVSLSCVFVRHIGSGPMCPMGDLT